MDNPIGHELLLATHSGGTVRYIRTLHAVRAGVAQFASAKVGAMYRAMLCVFLCFMSLNAAAFAQEDDEWEVRGNRVPLLAEPDGSSDVVATLRRGEMLRILGEVQHRSGETRMVDAGSLTPSISWFIPVEVVSTNQRGWLPEIRVRARETGAPSPSLNEAAEVSGAETSRESASLEAEPASAPLSTPDAQPVIPSPAPTSIVAPPTPVPVADLTPVLSEEEAAYVAKMLPIVEEVSPSLTRVTNLLGSPQLGDRVWEDLLQSEVDYWHDLYDRAEAIVPPESLADVHAAYLLGLFNQVESGDLMMASLRTLDVNGLGEAATLAERTPAHFREATRLLDEFMEDRGISPP